MPRCFSMGRCTGRWNSWAAPTSTRGWPGATKSSAKWAAWTQISPTMGVRRVAVPAYSSPQRTQRKSKEECSTHHSSYPVEQVSDVKVQQESHPNATQLQVRQQLRFVDRKNRFHRLNLQNYQLFNAKIYSKRPLDPQSVINDSQGNF